MPQVMSRVMGGVVGEFHKWSPTSTVGASRYEVVKAAVAALRAEGRPLVASDLAARTHIPATTVRAILRHALARAEGWYTAADKAEAVIEAGRRAADIGRMAAVKRLTVSTNTRPMTPEQRQRKQARERARYYQLKGRPAPAPTATETPETLETSDDAPSAEVPPAPRQAHPDCACCGARAAYVTLADDLTHGHETVSWCEGCWALLQEERGATRRSCDAQARAAWDAEHRLPAWRLGTLGAPASQDQQDTSEREGEEVA